MSLNCFRQCLIFISIFMFAIVLVGCDDEVAAPGKQYNLVDDVRLAVRTGERYFEIYDGENWSGFMVKGVNVGTSLPGRWYTQFPADRELYRGWLEDIAAMNANTVRLYTLLDPAFYNVLAEYNSEPGNETIWLIQEIWPHDDVPELNFYDDDYLEAYLSEIELVIDALHGNADIPSRPYRAYGNYSVDVSSYLLAVLIGRELEPEEVEATDIANPGRDGHDGEYVIASPGESSPTETWLAEMCDHTMSYSQAAYGWQYPVGFVSWPTLDPLDHKTEYEEDGTPGYNVRETVDPNIFSAGPASHAGFFGAYHIYPNYPDFMNNEPAFAEYEDEEGVFRYKGYLNQFMEIHPPYPALVAEFGISTSLNTSHLSPDGLHHGGLDEIDQGEMTVRMMRSIVDEGYAGGVIFEWTDEWAKKTWNTEPYMVPWERQVLWQNAMCPEQNYGLVAVEPAVRSDEQLYINWRSSTEQEVFIPLEERSEVFGKIRSIETGADEAFLYLSLELDLDDPAFQDEQPWEEIGIAVGIDTGFREAGEFILPFSGLPELPTGAKFLLDLASPEEADLLTVPTYNRGDFNFFPQPSRDGYFTRIETLVNRERVTADGRVFEALYSDESKLQYGSFDPDHMDYNALAHWNYDPEKGKVVVRLPWMLLNISDPSERNMLADPDQFNEHPVRDELSYQPTKGFIFYALTYSKQLRDAGGTEGWPQVIDFEPRNLEEAKFDDSIAPYLWDGWEDPHHRFRLKNSFDIIADYFAELDLYDLPGEGE